MDGKLHLKPRLKKPNKWRAFLKNISRSYGYLKTSWGVQTREFFANSTLHGVKYFAATDRPFIERFMWFSCVTFGAVATCVVIFSLWDKFQTYPTITGLDTDFHNWKVPFPAVAVCPLEPAGMENIREFLGFSADDTGVETNEIVEFYFEMSKLSLNTVKGFAERYHNGIPKQFNQSTDLRGLTLKLLRKCDKLFESCKFKDEAINCCSVDSQSFQPVLTENGLCYAFNSRHLEATSSRDVKFNMQYIKETDIKWSLEFSVNSQQLLAPIYIINSDDFIGIDVQPQLVWDCKVDRIAFSFKQTYTTEDTRQLSIKQRKCIFEDEVKLKVDWIYTYTACTIECRMETAKRRCGCVPFFYPEIAGFDYCDLSSLHCIAAHLAEIRDISKCNCQLGCKNTVYEVETQKTKEADSTLNRIEIGFVSWPMVRYKREVLFGWVDLLVSFGGIAGLFLGFSLLSGVEILYYFTIRACIASWRERRYLDRMRKEKREKPQPMHDLSLIPYFVSRPLPGNGIDIVASRLVKRNAIYPGKNKLHNTNPIMISMMPPFGIEFLH
ncbi:hypothetical protein HUJ05_011708 [Dendroctonus ponderosae]|nr:hypothetical protein HUJ05_011708 [Dendroctonus ponderosae]